MKTIAIFLVSVALLSAAESAPSTENGKSGAPAGPISSVKNPDSVPVSIQVPNNSKLPQEQKKSITSNSEPEQAVSPEPHQPSTEHPTRPSTQSSPSSPITEHGSITPSSNPKLDLPSSTNSTTTITPPPTTTTTTITTTMTTTTPKSTTSTTPTTKPTPPPLTTPPTSSTHAPTTTQPSPSTPAPKPAERHFDGASFIGGAVLVLGLGAISGVLYMFYKARTDQNYRTL